MKTIISLGLAVALSSSPVVELGATVAKAQSLKDAELSSQNANTNLLSETQNESTSSTDVNSDEPLNQETVKPTDEVTEDVTDEQPSQEVVESTDEVTEDVVDEQPSQEVVKPEDEVTEDVTDEQPSQEVVQPTDEVIENVTDAQPELSTEEESNTDEQEAIQVLENESSTQSVDFETKNDHVAKGTLEFDIYFQTPLSEVKGMNLLLKRDGKELGNFSLDQLSGEFGNFTYTIETLNSTRQLSQDEDIYFVHVTINGLETGNYEAVLTADGYQTTVIPNINLDKYSKRVKFSASSSEMNQYVKIDEEYPTTFLVGDVNQDGKVSNQDYDLVFNALGTENESYDLNRDGNVDITDLSYIYGNIGAVAKTVNIEDTNLIVDMNEMTVSSLNTNISDNQDISNLFIDDQITVNLSKNDNQAPSEESPLTIDVDFGAENEAVLMDKIVIKVPTTQTSNDEVGIPEKGFVTYVDDAGKEHTVSFDTTTARAAGDITIDLGSQVAVKKISINVTGNRGNKSISQIAKVEFLNNVYKELPAPDMNIPVIKTVETSTNLHDERITLTWDAEPNVTSYEVTYEQLDENTGAVLKTKKLQTNEPKINILDKDITPYSLYRVKVQSLSGEWSSGYATEDASPVGFDKKPDNVDENYNPIQDYYNGNIGSVTEVQVIPIQSPDVPINLVTKPGYKSFSVTWEKHIQARDFDIYYRKVGDENKKWIKANENRIEVSETDAAVTNPSKDYLVRAGSYTINGLEDNATYEVRVTATNHLGTSKMSDSYLASTENITPPVMLGYKLINLPNQDSLVGTEHIVNVTNKNDSNDEGGWGSDSALTYDSKYALVDGDFGTSWKVNDWDTGAVYGSNRGSIIEFDDTYTIGSISFAQSMEQGYKVDVKTVKITYWTEDNQQTVKTFEYPSRKVSNTHNVFTLTLDEPIDAKKIKVDIAGYGGSKQSISELRFYHYDSLENDVKDLFKDELRVELKETVTEEMIQVLVDRANTVDPISQEYHPNRETILKELQLAQDLLDDQNISQEIVQLDASLRDNGAALGMANAWQSLGAVARPSVDENSQQKTISVYMGSSDANTQVEIAFLQAYGQPGQYISKTTVIKPGRTEITIPEIFTADVEKGGAIMAKVKSGATDATVQIRLSNIEEIPHLNVNNLINDEANETEVKSLIKDYITELTTYVNELPSKYPSSVTDEEKLNNVYSYDQQTSVLNWTDIEGDRFTLSVPATEILKGIQSGNLTLEQQVDRVYEALLAWEQEMLVTYAKKGVFESVQDFDQDGEITSTDTQYYNKHKAPTTRLNVKYQRMIMGAAAYASSHHVGIGYGTVAGLIQGVPYKIGENGEVTNKDTAKFYGALMGHEIGHVVDTTNRVFPETSNNLLAELTDTMLDEDAPKVSGALTELYQKVTSNTAGLSTNRNVVLGMLWQPHLAYDNESTYKMLLTNFDGDLLDDTYFAKLNRAYREMTAEEKANGDRDQWLIRLSSKAVGKDLTDFYEAHGIIANATTLAYVSQFEKETRPIQYINDEARRRRLEGTAEMPEATQLQASFGNGITDRSYVNAKTIPFEFSVTTGNDNILGYEIIRNGQPAGFVLRDKNNAVTTYEDVISGGNNMTYSYEVVAYDYNLNATNKVSLGTVKVRHDGGIPSQSLEITSSTVDVIDENNDFHAAVPNPGLANILDGDTSTIYEGRKLTSSEYNTMDPHNDQLKPNITSYIQLDLQSVKSVIGLKYTAPVTNGLFKSTIGDYAIKNYQIDVSVDGTNWTIVNKGTFKLDANNPTEMIYFGKDGVEAENQLNTYQIRYVRLYALAANNISVAELELVGPPGDNIEIGVSSDNQTYENGIGILSEDYIYQADNPETADVNEEQKIPQGSVVITGEYSGNPAFNIPLVLNENDQHIADEYNGILLANIPSDGDLEEISEGTWIYWVEPKFVEQFKQNQSIFAELYRTDTANLTTDGQRLVSNTFMIDVPENLPSISFNKTKTVNHQVVKKITKEQITNITR